MIIYNLTNYNLQFIYNLAILQFIYILADFLSHADSAEFAELRTCFACAFLRRAEHCAPLTQHGSTFSRPSKGFVTPPDGYIRAIAMYALRKSALSA